MSSSQRPRDGTPERLLRAAAAEFNEHGFGGTDTNRIARRAGFAPQTFYRWYQDKVEIFIKTLELWLREEFAAISTLLEQNATDEQLTDAVVAYHKAYLVFRRSLRQLSMENDAVRASRARSRLAYIEYIRKMSPKLVRDNGSLAVTLFQMERLADALAEGEFQDMGLEEIAGKDALRRLIHELRFPE